MAPEQARGRAGGHAERRLLPRRRALRDAHATPALRRRDAHRRDDAPHAGRPHPDHHVPARAGALHRGRLAGRPLARPRPPPGLARGARSPRGRARPRHARSLRVGPRQRGHGGPPPGPRPFFGSAAAVVRRDGHRRRSAGPRAPLRAAHAGARAPRRAAPGGAGGEREGDARDRGGGRRQDSHRAGLPREGRCGRRRHDVRAVLRLRGEPAAGLRRARAHGLRPRGLADEPRASRLGA